MRNLTLSEKDAITIYSIGDENVQTMLRALFGVQLFVKYPRVLLLKRGTSIHSSKRHKGFTITAVESEEHKILSIGSPVYINGKKEGISRFSDDEYGNIYFDTFEAPNRAYMLSSLLNSNILKYEMD